MRETEYSKIISFKYMYQGMYNLLGKDIISDSVLKANMEPNHIAESVQVWWDLSAMSGEPHPLSMTQEEINVDILYNIINAMVKHEEKLTQ